VPLEGIIGYQGPQRTVVLEKEEKKKKRKKKTHVKEDIQKETYDVYTSESCGEFKNWIQMFYNYDISNPTKE
jgi:hypothetical protein